MCLVVEGARKLEIADTMIPPLPPRRERVNIRAQEAVRNTCGVSVDVLLPFIVHIYEKISAPWLNPFGTEDHYCNTTFTTCW